ncbi:MAG: EthD domain-containing protein, partial [Steroidobacteraceae bacterium]
MFKLLLFFWPKIGLSQREFFDYYEHRHAPLGARLTGGSVDYRRNYPIGDGRAPGEFWVITEVWHDARAGLEAQIATRGSTPVKETLNEDEAAFMDRERRLSVVVEECITHRSVAHDVSAPLEKLMRFVLVRDAEEAAAFRKQYEGHLQRGTRGFVHHIRNYPLDDPFTSPLLEVSGRRLAAVEELWRMA